MTTYLIPIKIALVVFPIISALIVLPVYIHQYRKYGFINKLRMVTIYAFVLYMICAYFEVILPLPTTRDIISLLGTDRTMYDLSLFSSIRDIFKETQVVISEPSTYLHLLKERAFLQLIFNIMLTVPFGIFMRYLFNRKFPQTVLYSFLLTLFFEVSQLTGLFGIYNAPYRLFSVDDLMLNTIGGMIGYAITPIVTFFIPSLQDIDSRIKAPVEVGILRRVAAYALDWIVIEAGIFSLSFLGIHIRTNILAYIIIIFVYFVVIPFFTRGYTIGKRMLGIKLADINGNLTFKKLFFRSFLFYFSVFGVNRLLLFISNELPEEPTASLGILIFLVGWNLFIIINFICNLKSHKFFHDKISGIQNVVVDFDSGNKNKK